MATQLSPDQRWFLDQYEFNQGEQAAWEEMLRPKIASRRDSPHRPPSRSLPVVDVIGSSGVGYDPGMDPATIAAYEQMFGNIMDTGSIIDPSQLEYDPAQLRLAGLGATEIDGQILPGNRASVEALREANPIVPASVIHPASYNPYTEAGFSTGAENLSEAERLGMHWSPSADFGVEYEGANWGREDTSFPGAGSNPPFGTWTDAVNTWVHSAEGQMFLANQTDETGDLAPEALDIPISPQFPYTLRELLDADILTIETLSNAHRNALTSAFDEASAGLDVAEQDYGNFLQNILYGTEDAPGFLSLTGGAVDQYRTGMGERESAFQSRRTQLFDELMAAGVDPSLIADDLAAGDDTAGAIAAIEGGYLDTLNLIGGLSEAAMRGEGERRFSSARGQTSRDYNAAQREADLAEAAALAGVQGAGRTAEMFAPYAEIDPGLFYAGTQAGLPIVQMAETRRGERRADARTAAAQAAAAAEKTEAEAGQQATLNYLSEYLGFPPELIGALSDVGQLGDLFPEFEEQEPSPYEYITDPATGATQVEYVDPATNAKYWIDRARLEEMEAPDEPDELSMIEQLYQAFPADAPMIFGEAIEQVRLSGNALNLEEAIQNAMLAAIAGG